MDIRELQQRMPRKAWKEVKEKMYRHTRGVGLGTYLKQQRPNEPEEVLNFRVKTLNKLTKDVLRKGLNNSKRMLLETPLLLDCNEEVEALAKGDNFDSYGAYVDLHQRIIKELQNVIEDPNGLLAVIPISLGEDINPQNTPLNERVFYYIDYIPSDNVYYFSNEMAIYEWRGVKFLDDANAIYQLIENENSTRTELWYNHQTGHKLSTYLGGYMSSDENGNPFLDSFFDGAVEYADAFINQNENLKAEFLQNSFPIREFREIPCNNHECKKGQVPDLENGGMKSCGTCNGSGKLLNYNTNTIFTRPRATKIGEVNTNPNEDPLVSYYSAPMEGTKLNKEYTYELLEKAGEAIGATIQRTNQSGVAKEEDKESYYSMLAQILENTARLYQFTVSCIQSIWANDIDTPIKVTASKDIRMNSQSYLLNLVKTYKDAGLPEQLIANQLSEYVKRTTSIEDSILIKILPRVDVLYGKTSQDIVMLKSMANSPVNEYALFVHLNAYRIFKVIEFNGKTEEEIIEEFNTLAKAEFDVYVSENKTIELNEFTELI